MQYARFKLTQHMKLAHGILINAAKSMKTGPTKIDRAAATEEPRIVWNDTEWKKVAERAVKIKEQFPTWSWLRIVRNSQDDIAIDRRRMTFAGTASLSPMFEILGLDSDGNKKVALVTLVTPAQEEHLAAAELTKIPTWKLADELFTRLERLSAVESVVTDLMDMVTRLDNRLETVEVFARTAVPNEMQPAVEPPAETEPQAVESQAQAEEVDAESDIRPIKIVVIGPLQEQFQHIKTMVSASVPESKLELLWMDKEHSLPSMMPIADWCIISRHASHALMDRCKTRYNGQLIRCSTGGVTTVKQRCLDCYSQTRGELLATRTK